MSFGRLRSRDAIHAVAMDRGAFYEESTRSCFFILSISLNKGVDSIRHGVAAIYFSSLSNKYHSKCAEMCSN